MTGHGSTIPSYTPLYAESPDELTVDLGPSPRLAALLAASHGGALIIVLLLPLPLFPRLALIALVAASLYRALGVHALRRARGAVTAFRLTGDDACAVRRNGTDAWQEGRVLERWVHPRLTILVVRPGGRRRALGIVIMPDAAGAEALRRLRVRLRLQPGAG